MKIYFDHEKLDVYREAINFWGWVGEFLASISAKAAAKDQLDRASTSIPLNIAEGNGKFSAKDRARFFEMARGSALECVRTASTFCSCANLRKKNRWPHRRNALSGLWKCLSACCADFPTVQMCCGRKRRIIYPSTITSTSTRANTSRTNEAYPATHLDRKSTRL